MTLRVETAVIGGGQAGLAVSYYLAREGREHLVLERSDRPGEAWRNHRWDSFTLNTPRWQSRLPGVRYGADDPDGFMHRNEVVGYLEDLAHPLPVRYRALVRASSATAGPPTMFSSSAAARRLRHEMSWLQPGSIKSRRSRS
jgi:putative flavoprotein involved in K+ transport